jgi:hypothetical protein
VPGFRFVDSDPPTRRARSRLVVGLVILIVLVVAGAVVAFVLTRTGDNADAPPLAGPGTCASNGGRDQVIAYFTSPGADDKAHRAVESLRSDRRIAAMAMEDQQHAFERFKEVFKDQPELVRLTRIEAVPAALWVLPAANLTNDELAAQLRNDLSEANEIRAAACHEPLTRPT